MPLRPDRHQQLRGCQHEPAREPAVRGEREQGEPAQLDQGEPDRVADRGAPARPVSGRGPKPERDQPDAHDGVAGGGDVEVALLECAGHPGGEDQHPRDLDQDRQAVGSVVHVVGRREPGEVHPGPPDREEHHEVPDQRRGRVALLDAVAECGRGLRDGDHEGQVEQQLE